MGCGCARKIAKAVAGIAEAVVNLLSQVKSILKHNSNLSIDWANATKPTYITEDAAGNLDGLSYSRQQIANVIGSLAQVDNLLNNGTVSQGDHVGNLNQVTRPQ